LFLEIIGKRATIEGEMGYCLAEKLFCAQDYVILLIQSNKYADISG
jgi:hypothetical protein